MTASSVILTKVRIQSSKRIAWDSGCRINSGMTLGDIVDA